MGLRDFWSGLSLADRRRLLRVDKKALFQRIRSQYCSRCFGLFAMRYDELRGSAALDCPACMEFYSGLVVHEGQLTLEERLVHTDPGPFAAFAEAHARERERELQFMTGDICGSGWQKRPGVTMCALHTSPVPIEAIAEYWHGLPEDHQTALFRLREEDFCAELDAHLKYQLRICRDCRGNVLRAFKELKPLKKGAGPGEPAQLEVCEGHRLSVAEGLVSVEGTGNATTFFERAEEVEEQKVLPLSSWTLLLVLVASLLIAGRAPWFENGGRGSSGKIWAFAPCRAGIASSDICGERRASRCSYFKLSAKHGVHRQCIGHRARTAADAGVIVVNPESGEGLYLHACGAQQVLLAASRPALDACACLMPASNSPACAACFEAQGPGPSLTAVGPLILTATCIMLQDTCCSCGLPSSQLAPCTCLQVSRMQASEEAELGDEYDHPDNVRHAETPELAKEALVDSIVLIFKSQVEVAFREQTAGHNALLLFVHLALGMMEERVLNEYKELEARKAEVSFVSMRLASGLSILGLQSAQLPYVCASSRLK